MTRIKVKHTYYPYSGDSSGDDLIGLADEEKCAKNLYQNPDGTYSEEVRAITVDEFGSAVRDGRAFSVGTGTVAVTNSNYMKYKFKNPTNSGKNAFVVVRQFTTDATTSLPELHFFVNPDDLISPSIKTSNNMNTGGGTSIMDFTVKTEATPFAGTPNISYPLPINGIQKELLVVRLVKAGESFGYEFAGAGGGVNNALRAASTIFWYEEPESMLQNGNA